MLDGYVDLERDRELVELHQGGDVAAFAELYSHYHRRLKRYCQSRLRTPHDADEAVQESFVRAWRAFQRFEGGRRFYPWLTVIASNVCSDMAKRRSRVVPVENLPEDLAAAEPGVDAALMGSEEVELMAKAFGRLSDRHRRILSLRETALLTSRRIAEHEGMKVNAVDVTLFRARQALKREMAALVDIGGGFAAFLGMGALRRAGWRTGVRLSGWWAAAAPSTFTPRGSSVMATVLISGAAAVATGGGVAVVAHAVSSPVPVSVPASAPASLPASVPASVPAARTQVSAPGAGSPMSSDVHAPAATASASRSGTPSISTVHQYEASTTTTTTTLSHGWLVSKAQSPASTAGSGAPNHFPTSKGIEGAKSWRPDGSWSTDTRGQFTDTRGQFTDTRGQFTAPVDQVNDTRGQFTAPVDQVTDPGGQVTDPKDRAPASQWTPDAPHQPLSSGTHATEPAESSPSSSPAKTELSVPTPSAPSPPPTPTVSNAAVPPQSAPISGVMPNSLFGASRGQPRPSDQTFSRSSRSGQQRFTNRH